MILVDTASSEFPFGCVDVPILAGKTGDDGTAYSNANGLDATQIKGLKDDAHGNSVFDIQEGCALKVQATSLDTANSRSIYATALVKTLEADS